MAPPPSTPIATQRVVEATASTAPLVNTVAPTAPAALPEASAPPSSVARSSVTPSQQSSPVERWRQIVNAVSLSDPKNGAFLAHAEVLDADKHRIHLRYERGSVASMALEDREVQAQICQIASTLFGAVPELTLVPREPENTIVRPTSPRLDTLAASDDVSVSSSPQSVFAVDREQRALAEQAALTEARNHPMVQEAVRVLGARLKHIELPKT